MKIVAINGSPKPKDSLSALIIERLARITGSQIDTFQATRLIKGETPQEAFSQILSADALLVVFPLYVDGLPAPLIELLTRLERAGEQGARPRIYAITNCGFYDAHQGQLSLTMVQLYANRAGHPWGYGISIGAGPMLNSMGDDWSKGPAADVQRALIDIARAMGERATARDVLVAPKFPRSLYKSMAHMGWRSMARKNKVSSSLRARPY